MRQANSNEIKRMRDFLHKLQDQKCPILKIKCKMSEMVLDHVHQSNARNLGDTDGGFIRGSIHRQANVMEGKISNSFIRCGLHKTDITLPDFLRNLADYLEDDTITKRQCIHPSEKPKAKVLKIGSFNKLSKAYSEKYLKRKELVYPKGRKRKGKKNSGIGRMTNALIKLFDEFGIKPEYRK